MANKRAIITVVVLLVVVNITLGIRWFIAQRSTTAVSNCINNLRQIDGAEQAWAVDKHKTTNDVPTWDELQAYLPQKPVCPGGGDYRLGRIGEPPTCSIGGRDHSLPTN